MVARLCSYLERSRDVQLHQSVVKCLSSMFTSTDRAVIDNALSEGVLVSFNRLLKTPTSQTTLYALFGLSNIAAGTADQARAIRSDFELLRSVIRSTTSSDAKVRTESLWILCNLINTTSFDELIDLLKQNEQINGEYDIIHPMCNNLTSLD